MSTTCSLMHPIILLVCCLFMLHQTGFSEIGTPSIVTENSWVEENEYFSTEIHLGLLYGKSFERVFNNTLLLSELTWPLENVLLLGISGKANIFDRFSIYGAGWGHIYASKTTETDKDWNLLTHQLQVYSQSEASLEQAWIADLGLSYNIYETCLCDQYCLKLHGALGYMYNNWNWVSRGGFQIVYAGQQIIDEFPLPNEPVLEYEQCIHIPYLGIALEGSCYDLLYIDINFRIGPFTFVNAYDTHYLQNDHFMDKFQGETYWTIGSQLKYTIWNCFETSLSYSYSRLDDSVGDTKIIDGTTGDITIFNNGAGAGHFHSLISVAVTYKF